MLTIIICDLWVQVVVKLPSDVLMFVPRGNVTIESSCTYQNECTLGAFMASNQYKITLYTNYVYHCRPEKTLS